MFFGNPISSLKWMAQAMGVSLKQNNKEVTPPWPFDCLYFKELTGYYPCLWFVRVCSIV